VWSFDLHAVFDPQHAFLDLGQLAAVRIFENQRLAHAQCLAVHFEDLLPVIILDPEVVTNGSHLLAHLVAVAASVRSPKLAILLPFLSSTSWHLNLSLSD